MWRREDGSAARRLRAGCQYSGGFAVPAFRGDLARALRSGAIVRTAILTRWPQWAALVLVAGLATPPARAQQGAAYLRTVEGYAEHVHGADAGLETLTAAVNTPLAVGDRLSVSPEARVEAVLADGSLLRIGGASELVVAALARSLDRADPASAIDLERGSLQVTRPAYAGPESLAVRLRAATVYLEAPGAYRLSSDAWGSASVTVREGFAELATAQGSSVVRASETGWLDGLEAPRLELTQALGRDDLELWAEHLDAAARMAAVPYIEESMAYAAAPLADHGGWVEVSGRPGWQPYAGDDWRPYGAGSWSYGPGGLNWISAEPWGWVTSHYGAWDYLPGFGWVWFPGAVYSPAWVVWYWGPTHVGWVPAGVALSPFAGSFPTSGAYGWVGGSWSDYSLWSFCRLEAFDRRGLRGRFSTGAELARETRSSSIPRGLLATDTRSLTPEVWRDPDMVRARLLGASARPATAALPQVTLAEARPPVSIRAAADGERGAPSIVRSTPARISRPALVRPSSAGPIPTRPHLLGSTPRPGAPSRPPTIARPSGSGWPTAASPSQVWSRPPTEAVPRPFSPSAAAPSRPVSVPNDDRPVVRRVVEDIRATRESWHRPAAPPHQSGSWRAPSRPPQSEPRSSDPPARGAASSRKPPRS